MTQNRTVEFMLTREQVADVQDITGFEKFNAAIGYLSAWNMSFPQVSISGGVWDDNPEMTATYFDAEGKVGYVIGAVWHGDHFGMHS